MIKQLNLDKNKIWAWGGDWNLLMHSKGGRFHECEWGLYFFESPTKLSWLPLPHTSIKRLLPKSNGQSMFIYFLLECRVEEIFV